MSTRLVDLRPFSKGLADVYAAEALPFAVNPRGVLVHRVKSVGVYHSDNGSYSHHSVHYHCNSFASGVSLAAEPDEKAIVCQVCENRCHYLGLPSAAELVGRHVHVGRKVAIANCCPDVKAELAVEAQHVALGIGGGR